MKRVKKLITPAVCLGVGITLLCACEKSTEFAPSTPPANNMVLGPQTTPPPVLTGQGGSSGSQYFDYRKLDLAPKPKYGTPQTGPAPVLTGQGGSSGVQYYDYRKLNLAPKLKPDPDPEPWKEITKP
ncbi:MAG: hypothetical protein ACKOWL_04615 [Sphingobacteriaceae bacterium]